MHMKCPLCRKNCKNENEFLKHLEINHKNEDCQCGDQKGGVDMVFKGADKEQMKNFEMILKNARSKIEKVDKDMKMNAIKYGLKIGKKNADKLPEPVKDKIKNVLLENEYLKGMIKAQEKQIRIMKTHINKCIDTVDFSYVVKK